MGRTPRTGRQPAFACSIYPVSFGAVCTQILAISAADIIKLEPRRPSIRVVPPHFVGDDSVYSSASTQQTCIPST